MASIVRESVPKGEPVLLDQHLEALHGPVVRVLQDLGDGHHLCVGPESIRGHSKPPNKGQNAIEDNLSKKDKRLGPKMTK